MKYTVLSATLLLISSGGVFADVQPTTNHGNMNHAQHMTQMNTSAPPLPTEAGQASFAAIAEIVKILSDNPNTDWSKVNINDLREHLLDMDRLVMGAGVNEEPIQDGMRFNVTGQGAVLRAIQHMVPAHAIELAKIPEYTAITETIQKGIALIITSDNSASITKIKALGFFGLMATGSHHQPHHFNMATGQGHMMSH